MNSLPWLVGLALSVTTGPVLGVEVPLTFKALDPGASMDFAGGHGAYASLLVEKPSGIVQESPAASAQPLYGELSGAQGDPPIRFRVDESKGSKTGYDRLIVDINRNGDLTDDPVVEPAAGSETGRGLPSGFQHVVFGPIDASAQLRIDGGKPVYYAQVFVYPAQIPTGLGAGPAFVGQLRLRAGWYLEGIVPLEGASHRIGLVDGNANLRLGDAAQGRKYQNAQGDRWYFQPGDGLLWDRNSSGRFDNDSFDTESASFGSAVYLGGQVWQLELSSDYRTVRLRPWPEPLAQLVLKPQGDQVRTLALARQSSPDDSWELLHVEVTDGKAAVPPGSYRIYSCVLAATSGGGDLVQARAYNRELEQTYIVAAGATLSVKCGGPIKIGVEANIERRFGLLVRTRDLVINMTAVGAGGEIFSSYSKGRGEEGEPPKPTFKITGADGQPIASGSLEFG